MSDVLITGFSADAGGDAPDAQSAVSWGAVFAGGVTAAAVAIILSLLGAGLGLASVSPWHGQGVSVAGFTALAAVWLIIVQWVASFFGGYMAGRLRTKWVAVHTDEVFFRDTAHGFLAWGLSVLLSVAVLAGVSASVAGNTTQDAAMLAANNQTSSHYYTQQLFRLNAGGAVSATGVSAPGVSDAELNDEAATILAEGAAKGSVPAADQAYLAQLVSQKTGLAPADAQARVQDVLNREQADIVKAKQVADAARKAAAAALIYNFVALLIGAFIASVAGAVGGRLRDSY